MRPLAALALATALVFASCGGAVTPVASTTSAPASTAAAVASAPQTIDVSALVARSLETIPAGSWAITTVPALKEAQGAGAYVVDVREPSEYAAGHILGAVNIPLRTVARSLDRIPHDRAVIVYCRSSYRAGIATMALQLLGYATVRNFIPAFPGWEAAQEPVAKDAVAARSFGAPAADARLVASVDKWLSAVPDDLYNAGSVAQLKAAQAAGSVVVVDVREPLEYRDGHIPGAINIPIRDLAVQLSKLPRDRSIALYSSENHRAGMSLTALQLLGLANARGFHASLAGWMAAGEQVDKTPAQQVERTPAPSADPCD